MQTKPKTSALAILSFTVGIISLYAPFMYAVVLPRIGRIEVPPYKIFMLIIMVIMLGLNPPFALSFSVAALTIGLIALLNIKKSNGTLKGKGLAAIGSSISLGVVGAMIVLNILFIMGEFGLAQRYECRKNLSSLAEAIKIYTKDHQDMYPPAENWQDILVKNYNVSLDDFKCPESDANKEQSCYAININVAGKKVSEVPPGTVLLFETNPAVNPSGGPESLILIHHIARIDTEQGCNVLFADGRIRHIKKEDLSTLRWTSE